MFAMLSPPNALIMFCSVICLILLSSPLPEGGTWNMPPGSNLADRLLGERMKMVYLSDFVGQLYNELEINERRN
jgi:hypothetical protein